MATNTFNQPLELINNKPNGTQMKDNGYGFYMFPSLVVEYANKVLTDRERRLYFAISGQAGKDSKGKPYKWALKHYCDIAHIKSNHYSEVLRSLCEKGFIIHTNFKSLQVLYPISQDEYISSNGKIQKRHNSQIGNTPKQQPTNNFSPKLEDDSNKILDTDSIFGNSFSLPYAYNKEINNSEKVYKEGELNSSQKWEEFTNAENERKKILKELQDLI